jgi:hypothetical protein
MTIKYGGNTKEVELVKGSIFPLPLTKSANGKKVEGLISYGFTLNNFDFDEKKLATSYVTQDGQISVLFEIFGDEGAKLDGPIKAGTYDAIQPTDDLGVHSKSGNVRAIIFEAGKATPVMLSNGKGTVKINSASGDTASGEIDWSDGPNSIKGTFTTTAYKR